VHELHHRRRNRFARSGVPSFNRLQRRQPALLYAFDLLELDGADLRSEPIEVRKATLATLLDKGSRPDHLLRIHRR